MLSSATSIWGEHDVLQIRSLSSGYGRVPVLLDVRLDIERGETLALLGRNGVGKSTLLRTIIGIVKPTDGSVVLDGVNMAGWPAHRLAKAGVAYVPQGRGIFPKLTVEENLFIGLRPRTDGLTTIPSDILDHFPILRERMKQPGGTLSGGEQQALAFARALCGAPSLLLLDEPSEGIQPSIVQQIGELLRTFNRDMGIAVLLVEQNLELARQVATRCLVMQKGRISGALNNEDLESDSKVFAALAL
jgi:urea ABC transporter ATP-binding protein UrtE